MCVGRTIFIKSKMLLFPYKLIISTHILKMFFFYQVIVLLRLVSKDSGRSLKRIQKNYNAKLCKLWVIFCHCIQSFMWILGICKPTFLVKMLPFYCILKNKIWKKYKIKKFLTADFLKFLLYILFTYCLNPLEKLDTLAKMV